MITVTLAILSDANTIQRIQQLMSLKLSNKTSYTLARIVKKLETTLNEEQQVFNEQRLALAKELGTPKEDGLSWDIKPEHQEEFNSRIKELLETKIEILGINPITLSKLGEVEVSTDVIYPLIDWLIIDDLIGGSDANK